MLQRNLKFVLYTHPRLKSPFDAASAERFLLYRQLVRSLTTIDAHGGISGDLASSWKISKDYKVYAFKLAPAKWSDGEEVVAADLVKTFEEGAKAPFSVHFDFSSIKELSAPDKRTFEIRFKKPQPNVLYKLSLPEAGLLYRKDFTQDDTRIFRVTAGAYSLENSDDKSINLTKNLHFSGVPSAPTHIHFDIHSFSPDKTSLLVKDADVVWPLGPLTESYENLVTQKKYRRVVSGFGWTNFFSINAKNMPRIEDRRYVQKILEPGFFDFAKLGGVLDPAKQLFMLGGPSFLPASWVDSFWSELSTQKPSGFPKKLKVAASAKGIIMPTVIERLEKLGIEVERVPYTDFSVALFEQKYDIILINNDFSSADLLENLNVTFSGKYVNLSNDSQIPAFMKKANAEPSIEKRFDLYKEVGKSLLTEGLIVPFAYQMVRHFVSERVKAEGLEEALLEFKLWQISLQNDSTK